MWRSKIVILLILIMALGACRGPYYNFKPEKHLSNDFFVDVPNIVSKLKRANTLPVEINDLSGMLTFQATFTEKLVERDAIPEWKLINENSEGMKVEPLDEASSGNQNILYLFILNPGSKNTICIFLGTGLDAQSNYKSIGPAYMGVLRMDQINMKRELKVVKTKESFKLELKKGKPIDMFWYLDREPLAGGDNQFLVTRIDYRMPNKIAGKKPVVYDIEKIFKDSTALIFSRVP